MSSSQMDNPYLPPKEGALFSNKVLEVKSRIRLISTAMAISLSCLGTWILVIALATKLPIEKIAMVWILIAMIGCIQMGYSIIVRSYLASTVANVLSWSMMVGILFSSHNLVPNMPKMSRQDSLIFFAIASGVNLLCILVSFVVCRRRSR